MLAPSQNTADEEEHNHHDGDNHLAVETLDLQHTVDAGCDDAGLVENLHNTADDHNGEHHGCGCGQTLGNRQGHLEQADGGAFHAVIAVGYHAGDAVHRLAVVGARDNKVGHHGADQHHDHQNQKRVQIAAEFLLFFLHVCSFFLCMCEKRIRNPAFPFYRGTPAKASSSTSRKHFSA